MYTVTEDSGKNELLQFEMNVFNKIFKILEVVLSYYYN